MILTVDTRSSISKLIQTNRLANDDIFTFIVGPEEAVFKVHVSILKSISEPLGYMMTNGEMKESLNKEASLPDIDHEVFAHLLKFAYQGLYAMSDGITIPAVITAPDLPRVISFKCHLCGGSVWGPKDEPFCGARCENRYEHSLFLSGAHCIVMDYKSQARPSSQAPFCRSHMDLTLSYIGKDNGDQTQLKSSNSFNLRKYGCSCMTHETLSQNLTAHRATTTKPWPLVQHAKTYALAKMYLVPDLPEIALHKLHRCLVSFKVSETTVQEVIELVLFTYKNTEDVGDMMSGTSDKLRDLVMAFVKDRSSTLIKHDSFSQMMGSGGPHTTDFFRLVCGQ